MRSGIPNGVRAAWRPSSCSIACELQVASYYGTVRHHMEDAMTPKFKGGCLCGAVRYESHADPMMAGHCHCADCRKSSGTGHCSHLVVPKASVAVTGKLTAYD